MYIVALVSKTTPALRSVYGPYPSKHKAWLDVEDRIKPNKEKYLVYVMLLKKGQSE